MQIGTSVLSASDSGRYCVNLYYFFHESDLVSYGIIIGTTANSTPATDKLFLVQEDSA